MNLRAYILLSGAAVLLFWSGCQQNPTEPTATKASTISGTVLDAENHPLALARVVDRGALSQVDTSKTDGSFKLNLELSDNYNTSLFAILKGYASDTPAVSVTPGGNVTGITIHMVVTDSSLIVKGNSGRAASIVLKGQTESQISLRGTGKNESCTLTFVVKDSLGNPVVGGSNQCKVKFTISAGPGGGEFLLPTTALTDVLTGEVSTTVTSGTQPGVIQVIATTRGDTVKASPLFLAMGSGLPDSAGVSIGATKLNIAGRVYGNLRTTINVSVGDRYGSPVAVGTMVGFRTDPVARVSAFSGETNKDGVASVDLVSTTNQIPAPYGLVPVIASTMGDKYYRQSDSLIVRAIPILFSGPTQVKLETTGSYSAVNFTIPDGGTKTFGFWVSDDRGFPLVAGSTVKVTMTAADTMLKDLQLLFGTGGTYTFEDTQSPSATHLYVGVLDKGTTKIEGYVTFGIEIISQNGNYSNANWFTGYVSGGSGGNFNVPASIELADSTVNYLYLRETGLPKTTRRLRFVVKDALGNIIKSPTKARVDFSFLEAPNGTVLSKTKDSTNSSGYVTVDVTAGDTAGTAIVSATTLDMVNGILTSAFSLPIEVAHGLPDADKVFIELNKTNMFNKSGYQVGLINLSLSDIYGTYAAPQNAYSDITVTTSGGYVSSVPLTVGGKASVGLFGSPYEPNDPDLGPGFGYVRTVVLVHGGGTTTKSVPFLFSYAPQIVINSPTVVDTITNAFQRSLADGGVEEIQFTVSDKNGNPISSGNTMKVTVTGDVVADIKVSGDVDLTFPGTTDKSSTHYRFTVSDKAVGSGGQGKFRITITVTGESGTVVKTIDGFLLAPNVLGGSSSGFAKYFTLVNSLQKRSIYVRGSSAVGTGRPETATLEFIALDSLGRPVDADHAVMMKFRFEGEDFGAVIERDSGLTDASGHFTTLIRSGTHSGVPYLRAYAVVNGDTIKSGLIDILISSGFADPFRFSVSAKVLNFPGMQIDGLEDMIRVQPFDRFGNPVPQNTPVWFYCTHGGVQTEDAYTDLNGIVQQTHYSGGTRPITPNNVPGFGDGFVFVKARTMGEAGQDIWDSVRVLWTGSPVSPFNWAFSGPDPFAVPHAGSAGPWTFQIRDAWGNPLSAGTTISVSALGTIVTMDPVTLPDTQAGANGAPAGGITNFSVMIFDTHKAADTPEPKSTILTVKVVHPIYGQFSFVIASGTID